MKKLLLFGLIVISILIVSPVSAEDYGETANPSFYTTVAKLQNLDSFNMGILNPGCVKIVYYDSTVSSVKLNDASNTSWTFNKSQSRYVTYTFRSDVYAAGARKAAIVWQTGACPSLPWTTGGTIGKWWNLSDSFYDLPQANFTGYPLDGYSPLLVNFTVLNSSAANETGFLWTWGDGQTVTSNKSSISHTYQNAGIYSVTMEYFNSSGYKFSVTKANYILASTPSGMIVNLDVKDAISGALIQDSTVGIRNTSTGVWRNTTAPTGLVYFSTTDPGYLYPLSQNQSITLAANKTGYRDASETFAIPYNNYRARLFLMPTTVINATGTGTVVVNTIRNKDGLTISGISVVLDSGQMGITNTAGATTLYNVTAGTRYVTLTDPDKGYQDAKSTFNLSAGETKLVVLQMVRVGEQPVETPGSPTPTPTGTYDPNDPNSPVYGNYTTSQINEQGGAGVLGMLAQLITWWPLVVVGVLFKFMKSAFS